MNQEEVWKKIEDFPKYEVSNRGNVRNIKIGKMLNANVKNNGYLLVELSREDQSRKVFPVHNLVAQYFIDNPNGYRCVGRIDRNYKNNNVENLRWETRTQSNMKKRKQQKEKFTSIYKGVSLQKCNMKWKAQIVFNGKNMILGKYESEIEAAQAYDEAAQKYFSDFARLNFEDEGKYNEDENYYHRCKKEKSSIYRGVSFNKQSQKWEVNIRINKKTRYLGQFETELEAAKAYDEAVKQEFKELAVLNLNEEESNKIEIKQKAKIEKTSIYRGVSFNKKWQKWEAVIFINKKNKHLGQYDTELEAAKVYDEAAKELHKQFAKLNLKEDERNKIEIKQKKQKTSIYRGVSFSKRDNKWIAVISVDNKQKYLGQYDTELEAAKAYDEAAKELHKECAKLNLKEDESNKIEIKQKKQKTSIYRGVYFKNELQKWAAVISVDNKQKYLGQFDTELEAAKAYDEAAKELHKECAKLNLKEDESNKIEIKKKKEKSSIYRGVSLDKQSQKWATYITVDNKQKYLGYFDTELEAAQAYDIAAKELYKESAELNFKDEVNIQSEKIKNFSLQAILQKGKKQKSSIYRGVTFYKKTQKWKVQIQVDKKLKYLGQFETEIEAARAYDKAAKELHKEFAKLNFKDEEELTEQLANLNINEDKQE